MTITAWLVTLFGGLGAAGSFAQAVLLAGQGGLKTVLQIDRVPNGAWPPLAVAIAERFEWLLLATGAVYSVAVVLAVGLWFRREWARLAFIALLGGGVVLLMSAAAYHIYFVTFMSSPDGVAGANASGSFRGTAFMVLTIVVVVYAAGAALAGWLIVQLRKPHIRAEFRLLR